MSQPIVVLEFNELSPVLMDRFITAGALPNFERLRASSSTFLTEAGEEGDLLNPWVQWVSVHTGATADEHGIGSLGEGSRLELPTIADVVGATGRQSWICGSMNVSPRDPVVGAWLPDPWSMDGRPDPTELEPFFDFVRGHVQEHTQPTPGVDRSQTIAFLRFLAGHGLRTSTVLAGVRQLAGEGVRRRGRWRRAMLLDRLQWDVFRWYHRRLQPSFATFFSNSTAHFQHVYWTDMEPSRFGLSPAQAASEHGRAIQSGYEAMDRLVGEAMAWTRGQARLVFCTGLSQDANEDGIAEYAGFHRPRRLDLLADRFGIDGTRDTAPVMAEQFRLFFADEDSARRAEAVLSGASVSGAPAFAVTNEGDALFVGSRFFHPLPDDAVLTVPQTGVTIAFSDLLYWCDAPRGGTHRGAGMFWIQSNAPKRHDGRPVPITSIAPTILELLGIDRPPSMRGKPLVAPAASR